MGCKEATRPTGRGNGESITASGLRKEESQDIIKEASM